RGLLHIQAQTLNPTFYPPTRLDPKDEERGVYEKLFDQSNLIVFKTAGRGGHYGPESLNGYRVIDPKPGDKSLNIDLTLWAGHSRRIKVVDPDAKPLNGAAATGLDPMSGFQPVGTEAVVSALDPERPRRLMFRHQDRKLFAMIALKGT